MKAGLTSSAVLHAIVIGWGLFSFSSPKTFDVADTEALPVDIVSATEIQQGEKKAAMKEKPAPKPTSKPKTVENAENAGDNELDLKTPPKPDVKPKPVETAEAAKPEPKPVEKPEPLPDPKPEPKPEPATVPATEVQPEAQPKQEVRPDAVAEAIEKQTESLDAETVKLPDKVPAPDAKPKPPQAQTAKTPDRKQAEQTERTASTAKNSSQEKDAIADEVRALLNREKASGGGAKRSTEQASLGGKKNAGSKLSQSELDALRSQISKCWNVPAGVMDAQGLRVTVKMRLTETGEIEGAPEVSASGDDSGIGRVAAESARRAIIRCAPYNLPRDKYDTWAEVIANFDPSEMF